MTIRGEDQALGAARARRRVLVGLTLKTVAVLLADFVLLRLAAPNLVNLHSDLALAGAVGCLLLALAATGWLAVTAWRDVMLSNRLRRPMAAVTWTRED
jgi:uncharacterized PurR-regulated membrane protein YhhQ (DUF165 family)